MSEVTIRPATQEDFDAFMPEVRTPTTIAWVGEKDGEILGMGGVAFVDKRWKAFIDLKPEARPYKMTIVKASRDVMNEIRKKGIKYVYAEVDEYEPLAKKWIGSMGFDVDPRSQYFYRWKAR